MLHVMSDKNPPRQRTAKPTKEQLELYTVEAAMDEEETARFLRSSLRWKDWVLYDYLRYWYAAGALLLDGLLLLTMSDGLSPIDGLDGLAIAVTSLGLVLLEAFVYIMIWPRGLFTDGISVRRTFKRWLRRLRG